MLSNKHNDCIDNKFPTFQQGRCQIPNYLSKVKLFSKTIRDEFGIF